MNLIKMIRLAALVALAAPLLAAGPALAAAGGGKGAGTATVFAGGVGGPGQATDVALSRPCGVVSSGGHLFFADEGQGTSVARIAQPQLGFVVRDLNEHTGWLSTAAGVGLPGYSGDGLASESIIGNVCWLAADHHGNIIMTGGGYFNPAVRVLATTSGTFYGQPMVAGHVYQLYSYGQTYIMDDAAGVAVDYAGNLVFSEPTAPGSEVVASVYVLATRSGVFYGQHMKAGHPYTIFQLNGQDIGALTVDGAGNPVVDNTKSMVVIAARSGKFDGRQMRAGGVYPLTSGIAGPAAADKYGNLVLANDAAGQQLDVRATRSGMFYGRQMRAGQVYQFSDPVHGSMTSGIPVSKAGFGDIAGVTIDQSGNWVISDLGSDVVRVVAVTAGRFYGQQMRAMHVYTVAGTGDFFSDSGEGGVATRAELALDTSWDAAEPDFSGVAADAAGDVYFADTPNDRVDLVPGHSGVFFGRSMRAGDLYSIAGTGGPGDAASGILAGGAGLGSPQGVAVDQSGNLLIADLAAGKVRVVADRSGTFYGIAMLADHIYTIAGGGIHRPVDGLMASKARLAPSVVKVDNHGNVLIADGGLVWVRPTRSGRYYDQQMIAGHVYLIAGGTSSGGTSAVGTYLGHVSDLAIDRAGNVLIVNGAIEVVATRTGQFYGQPMTAGDIYDITGHIEFPRGDGVRAIALDQSGNVIMSLNGYENLVQVLAEKTGSFYGQPMTTGDVYTIAGGGRYGYIPAGRRGTTIRLQSPQGIVVLPSGDLVLSELTIGRVLLIHG